MSVESLGVTACPFCGGEIRAAARMCKHCKRLLDTAPTSASAPPPAPPPPAAVLVELRAFLVAREMIRTEQFDPLAAQLPTVDAVVMLGHLAAAGYITAVQVEALREGFRQQQESRAQGLLRVAVERGFLTPAHVETGLAEYQSVIFQRSAEEHLVAAGLLTPTQAAELQRRMSLGGSVVTGARAWWGRLSTSGRWAVLGLVGVPVVGIAFALLYGVVSVVRGEANIRVDGTMNGYGRGVLTFTNRGSRAGSLCGHLFVTCGRGSRSSASYCSGTVAPHETKQVPVQIPGMAQIRDHNRDWDDDCEREFVRESSGD